MIETREQAAAFLSKLVYADSPGHLDMNFLIKKRDALEIISLLKEQEAVAPEVEVLNELDRLYRCPKCHKHFFYERQKYCDQCGQAIKW